jgi:methanogenic corrinoid protein MtbC1
MSVSTEAPSRRRSSRSRTPAEAHVRHLLATIIAGEVVPGLVVANRLIEQPAAPEHDVWRVEPASFDTRLSDAFSGDSWRDSWRQAGFTPERASQDLQFVSTSIRASDVVRFVRLLRGLSSDAGLAFVEILQARGISRNDTYLDLLAPAARMIGAMWQDDECSFADVTMVVGRLHHIVKTFHDAEPFRKVEPDAPQILLAPSPGEQHVFALDLVKTFFDDAGWCAAIAHTNDAEDILDMAAQQPFDAVGFTLSRSEGVDVLRATIMRLRAVSMRPELLVLVGGAIFDEHPELVRMVGAEAMAEPGLLGAVQARKLLPNQGMEQSRLRAS